MMPLQGDLLRGTGSYLEARPVRYAQTNAKCTPG